MKKILVMTVGLSCAISSLADSTTVSYLKDRTDPKGNSDGFSYAKKKVDLGERASTEGLIKRCIYNHISIHNSGFDDAAIQRNLKREPKFVYSREQMPQVSAGKDVAFTGGILFIYVNKDRMKYTPGLYCNGARADKRHMPLMADIYEVLDDPSLKTAKAGQRAGEMEIVPRDVSPKFRERAVGLRDSKDAAEAAVAASAQSTESTQTTSAAAETPNPEHEDEKLYALSGSPEYVAGLDSEKDAKVSGAIDRVAARRNASVAKDESEQRAAQVKRADQALAARLGEELSEARKEESAFSSESKIWYAAIDFTRETRNAKAKGLVYQGSRNVILDNGVIVELKLQDDLRHADEMAWDNLTKSISAGKKADALEAQIHSLKSPTQPSE